MSIRNLGSLFLPRSIAIIGASPKPHSVGNTVLQNLLGGPFKGEVFPVNPKYHEIGSGKACAAVNDLPAVPGLAVICTPPIAIPNIISELGARGTKAAIVMTAGLNAPQGDGKNLRHSMLDKAKPYLLRILGLNCVGLLIPHIGLNASFVHTGAIPGKITFVSQSGALVTGVLDWAISRGIGFSKFISIGFRRMPHAGACARHVMDALCGADRVPACWHYPAVLPD